MSQEYPFIEIKAEDFVGPCAKKINPDWMLVAAGNPDMGVACMTISFGGFGFIWGKYFAVIVIRHSRHTLPFIEANKAFSLAFFDETWRDTLFWCGRHSGREFNKIEHCGFNTLYEDKIPFFAQSQSVLLCNIMYRADTVPEKFVDPKVYDTWYNHGVHKGDMHAMIYASIDKVLIKKS